MRNRLFETLDPTTRGFEHEGRRYLVTDTVGFIRRLPHQLVEGFSATLEETLVADLVLHVVDGSDAGGEADRADRGGGRGARRDRRVRLPLELVVNKIDAVDALHRRRLAKRYPDALQVSALDGEGMTSCGRASPTASPSASKPCACFLPYDEGGKLNELYALGAPISSARIRPRASRRRAAATAEVRRFAAYLVADSEQDRATGGA